MNIKPHIFSFFSGAGFLDLGFEMAGYDVAFVNELHKPFLEAYQYSREKLGIPNPIYGYSDEDIIEFTKNGKDQLTNILQDSKKSTDIIGFIAGPPCPDFSVGGKNRGRMGEKGILSEAYFKLINKHKPDFFLFENVKGLWRTKKHRAFYDELKRRADDDGYVLTEKLINALDYGVPQDRDRIILIGFQRNLLQDLDKDANIFYPFLSRDFPWRQFTKYNKHELDRLPWPKQSLFHEDSIVECPSDIPAELTVEYCFRKNDVYHHPNSEHHFIPRAGLKKMLTIDEGDDSKKSYKRLHRWRYSPTAAYGNNEVHLHPYKPRRISAAEALAIQSLPKDFVLPENMSLSNMFKTIGNGVPFLAAKALASTITTYLES